MHLFVLYTVVKAAVESNTENIIWPNLLTVHLNTVQEDYKGTQNTHLVKD